LRLALQELSDAARTVLRYGNTEQYRAFSAYFGHFIEPEIHEIGRLLDERTNREIRAEIAEELIDGTWAPWHDEDD
jgi:hypothetical protein